MAQASEQAAWNMFWEQNARGGASGCLPHSWQAIEQAQKKIWQGFAALIATNAKLLDLATGDGRVLAWIGADGADLECHGVDLAPNLPPAPPRVTLRGGVAMEELPFEDVSFDAVTSQFGFEYGDTARVATEIARVLKPGGRVGLMMHRGDGPIVAHNRTRRAQLEWALEEKAIVTKTRQSIGAGSDLTPALPYATETVQEGLAQYGESSPAWEIPEAVRRTLLMGERAGKRFVLDTLDAIEAQAGNEIGRIKALIRASAVADDRETIEERFAATGIELVETKTIEDETSNAFASFVVLTKA